MGGHRPAVWMSDRCSAQQGHGPTRQTCFVHLAREVAYAVEASDDPVPHGFQLWLHSALDLARRAADPAASTLAAKRRALGRKLTDILAAPTACELARGLQDKPRRARGRLLTFAGRLGEVEATNNGCERDLRPCVGQGEVTHGYRAMWAAEGRADVRTVVDPARLTPGAGVFETTLQTAGA